MPVDLSSLPCVASPYGKGTWEIPAIGGHPADLYIPPGPQKEGAVFLYLHGVHLNRLGDKPAFVSEFDRVGIPVIAPFTARSWWTDRICSEFDPGISAEQHLLKQVLPFIKDRFGVEPPRIGIFGTSMGGQGALRLAYKYPNQFPVVAAISPAIDYHLRMREGDETLPLMYDDDEQARQDTALLHIHPLNWPRHQFFCCDPTDERWWNSADRLKMKLWSLGVPHECDLETSGGGHGFEYYSKMAPKAIQFLVDRLEKERLRIV
jgi:S-formylglutathione hydrolase FrmB